MIYFFEILTHLLMTNEAYSNFVPLWADHCNKKYCSTVCKCLFRNLSRDFFYKGWCPNESDVSHNSLDLSLYLIIREYYFCYTLKYSSLFLRYLIVSIEAILRLILILTHVIVLGWSISSILSSTYWWLMNRREILCLFQRNIIVKQRFF